MDTEIKQLPDLIKRRLELAKIFTTVNQSRKRKWGNVLHAGFDSTAVYLSGLAGKMRYDQEKINRYSLMWYDPKTDSAECMFCYIDNPTDLNLISSIFRLIKKFNPMFTYGIVKQAKEGAGVYDIFRFSRFSFLEHHNRMKAAK